MDLVIVREDEEDLYAGIEHRQTDQVYQCHKLITRPGTEKIVRYAFEFALALNHARRDILAGPRNQPFYWGAYKLEGQMPP